MSSDGRMIAVLANCSGVEIYTTEGKLIRSDTVGHTIWSMEWARDDKSIFFSFQSSTRFGEITRVDSTSGRELRKYPIPGDIAHCITISLDGFMMAVCLDYGIVVVWDISVGEELFRCGGHSPYVHRIEFSPDGQLLALYREDGPIDFVHTGGEKKGKSFRRLQGRYRYTRGIAFYPDGNLIATNCDGTLQFWNVHTGQLVSTLDLKDDRTNFIRFSPNGAKLVSGISHEGEMRIWSISSANTIQNRQTLCENASIAWQSAALVTAFFRANSGHRFKEVILRPDLLPVILQMASPPQTYLELKRAIEQAPDEQQSELIIVPRTDLELRNLRESFAEKISQFVDSVFARHHEELQAQPPSSSSSKTKKRRRRRG
jgi:WD40 repeat protein